MRSLTRRTAAAMLAIALQPVGSVAAQSQPHIVVILADDMGYGDPGCYSTNDTPKIATPHIDRIAREGMKFTDAHAPGALCVPSRYGLLTGRFPARRGTFRPGREAVIRRDRATLASILKGAGYRTAMVGKWHLGFDNAPTHGKNGPLTGGPVDRGFDSWFGIPASLDIPPYYYVKDRNPLALPTEQVAAGNTDGWTNIQGAFWRKGGIAPDFRHEDVLPRCRDAAVTAITAHAQATPDAPLFLYLALPAPHTPWLPDEELRGKSGVGMYGDFVMQVDGVVGDVLNALDTAGMGDDTLVVFSSDNGPVWYPNDVERFGHASTGPFRGMKADAWEGGHRVPFLVRWPGQVTPGTTSKHLVCFTDLLATCADAAKAELPEGAGEDSVSFLPALRNGDGAKPREALVLKANASVVRDGDWKWIGHRGSGGFSRPRRGPATEPPGQLYDLSRDPGETTNVWREHPEVVGAMERRAATVAPTNIVVIMADDMGYGDASVYDGWIQMKGLERMAREGMVFTDFHTSGVVCSPTRAGLLTGRYQHRAGLNMVVNADPKVDAHHRGLQDVEWTFAEALGAKGYRTGLFGKWHLGYTVPFNPLRHGFDEFIGFVSGNVDYHTRYDRMQVFDWWRGEEKLPDQGYMTDRITDHAVRFIQDHGDEPFCLYVAHGAPHSPIQDPNSPKLRGPDKEQRKDPRKRDEVVRGMMARLDSSVTAILDAVRAKGVARRTLVLFFSDNGGAGHMRNDPLRGRKGSVWEGGHRVPCIAWWPSKIAKGSRCDTMASSLDVMPTMLALAGIEAPTERPLDGRSLLPLLRGREQDKARRQLFWTFNRGRAMRDGRWKLVVQNKKTMLFDVAADIGEKNDVAAEHPDRVAAMTQALAAWQAEVTTNATKQPR